jgi:hypothetical protein
MALTLTTLDTFQPGQEQEVLDLAEHLTDQEVREAAIADLLKLRSLVLTIEGSMSTEENLSAPVLKTLKKIVARDLIEKSQRSRAAGFDSEAVHVDPHAIQIKNRDYNRVIGEMKEHFGESKAAEPELPQQFLRAQAHLEEAIKQDKPQAMSKQDLGIFFAHADPQAIGAFTNNLSEKASGIKPSSTEDYSHDGAALLVAFQDLLQNRTYLEIRSDPWLTHLGSRTFMETFYTENQARFAKVAQSDVFKGLIDGALHTSVKGHDKSGLSFGLFGKSSRHNQEVLGKIDALTHTPTNLDKKKT